jgi:hypothetical protein
MRQGARNWRARHVMAWLLLTWWGVSCDEEVEPPCRDQTLGSALRGECRHPQHRLQVMGGHLVCVCVRDEKDAKE